MKQLDDFFFNDTATTEIYTLSLHDALPICGVVRHPQGEAEQADEGADQAFGLPERQAEHGPECQGRQDGERSEEHTSELQSRQYLVCRLLLEKKKFFDFYLTILSMLIRH